MKKLVITTFVLLICLTTEAQKKPNKNAKLSFWVDGVCMMCKKRIEKAALSIKGVKFASWDLESHKLSMIIDERKTNKKAIEKKIVSVGHDTKTKKSKTEVYNNIDPCCKYRDEQVVKDHQKPKKG